MNKLFIVSNLKYLRLKNKMTQKELGNKLGIGNTAIANYEAGNREIDASTLYKLSRIFNISTDSLIFDDLKAIEVYGNQEIKALRNELIHKLNNSTQEELEKIQKLLELIK